MIQNLKVYGLENSVRVSKFPMVKESSEANSEVTNRTNSLASAPMGSGHENFLLGIVVQFDLEFTIKAWTEAQRYHFFEIVSSMSTMHRITHFDLDKAYIKYVDPIIITRMKELVDSYNNETDPEQKKEAYLRVLYSNPVGMKLTAGITTNYRQLRTMYHQRKTHRLPEWRQFCEFIKTLPYSEWITN